MLDGDHHKPFDIVYKTKTVDTRPSRKERAPSERKKLNFSPSVQHFKNTKTMVQFEECNKWRLVFSKRVLKDFQRDEPQRLLEETAYTCGLLLEDLLLPQGLDVFIKDHDCSDPMEKLYYSCGMVDICFFCAEYLHGVEKDSEYYPQCIDCKEQPVKKRQSNSSSS